MPTATKDERRELLNMLSFVQRYDNRPKYKRKPLTVEMRTWEKRIDNFKRKQNAAERRFSASFESMLPPIRQEIYFGDVQKALKMIEALKNFK